MHRSFSVVLLALLGLAFSPVVANAAIAPSNDHPPAAHDPVTDASRTGAFDLTTCLPGCSTDSMIFYHVFPFIVGLNPDLVDQVIIGATLGPEVLMINFPDDVEVSKVTPDDNACYFTIFTSDSSSQETLSGKAYCTTGKVKGTWEMTYTGPVYSPSADAAGRLPRLPFSDHDVARSGNWSLQTCWNGTDCTSRTLQLSRSGNVLDLKPRDGGSAGVGVNAGGEVVLHFADGCHPTYMSRASELETFSGNVVCKGSDAVGTFIAQYVGS